VYEKSKNLKNSGNCFGGTKDDELPPPEERRNEETKKRRNETNDKVEHMAGNPNFKLQ
jgi:hypothetical protein